MAASLLAEAGAVAHVLDGQVALLKPALAVEGAQRLLAGGDEVLVVALACRRGVVVSQEEGSMCQGVDNR